MAADGHASTLAGRVGALVDRLARSPVASLAAIAVVALACYVPGFSTLPPLDGVEPGHMVAARAMVESGDYAAIRLQTANRTWSPRGAYWAEALAITLAGQGGDPPAWVYRLPSLIAAVAACLLTWWAAMAFGRPRAALLAGLLMAASGVAALMARQASPDSLTLAAATVAAGALARVWLGEARPSDSRLAWLFWAALGAGVLVNGLVLPATFAATIVLLSIERGQFGWLTRLRPRRGMVVLLVAIMPWALAVALTYLGGAAAEAPSAETLARLSVPFSLKAAPGTYILFTPLLLGPALAFLCLGMAWIVDDLRRPVVFFTLAWAGPLWLAAEFVEAKLPQVVLPVIPAIAIVTGAAIDAGAARVAGWARRLVSVGPVLWRWGLAFAAPFIFLALQGHFPFSAFLVFLLAAAAGIVAWLWLMRGEAWRSVTPAERP
ncbi:MAG: glycosyltransferase family 39 protein, partial [Bauldia sp.]